MPEQTLANLAFNIAAGEVLQPDSSIELHARRPIAPRSAQGAISLARGCLPMVAAHVAAERCVEYAGRVPRGEDRRCGGAPVGADARAVLFQSAARKPVRVGIDPDTHEHLVALDAAPVAELEPADAPPPAYAFNS